MKKKAQTRIVMMCEECGKLITPDNSLLLNRVVQIPTSFVLLCYDCYVDFKHRRPPYAMHYQKAKILQLAKTETEKTT